MLLTQHPPSSCTKLSCFTVWTGVSTGDLWIQSPLGRTPRAGFYKNYPTSCLTKCEHSSLFYRYKPPHANLTVARNGDSIARRAAKSFIYLLSDSPKNISARSDVVHQVLHRPGWGRRLLDGQSSSPFIGRTRRKSI